MVRDIKNQPKESSRDHSRRDLLKKFGLAGLVGSTLALGIGFPKLCKFASDSQSASEEPSFKYHDRNPKWVPKTNILLVEKVKSPITDKAKYVETEVGTTPRLWIMDPETTLQRKLTSFEKGYERNAYFSPDGEQIVFEKSFSRRNSISLINSDGTNFRELVSPVKGGLHFPVWSPDGTKIAFRYCSNDNLGLYTMDPDGSNIQQLKKGYNFLEFIWSPDSQHLFIGSGKGIESIRRDGSDFQVLRKDSNECSYNHIDLSPNGEEIIFDINQIIHGSHNAYHSEKRIGIIALSDPSQEKVLNSDGFNPCFTPDGKKIVFESGRDGNKDLFIMGKDGSNLRNLTQPIGSLSYQNAAFSDDGKFIAFEYIGWGSRGVEVQNLATLESQSFEVQRYHSL